MWNIAGKNGDISGMESLFFSVDLQRTAVGMTDPNLQTVMKMKASAGNIGNLPIITGQKQYLSLIHI